MSSLSFIFGSVYVFVFVVVGFLPSKCESLLVFSILKLICIRSRQCELHMIFCAWMISQIVFKKVFQALRADNLYYARSAHIIFTGLYLLSVY